ncbi:MAG: DNA primase [Oceanococcus sp.]
MIPQDFIDDLLSRTDIVELIRPRVELKRAGREWKGCCPFHNEKTPSFHVVPQKQFYHCFGCGAHGHALQFVMDHDRLDFPAAVEVLAQLAGVEIPRQAGDNTAAINKSVYEVLDRAHQRFRDALSADSPAQAYLLKRGVNAEMIARYELGYAPPGWGFLTDKISPLADAETAGLLIRKDGGKVYDRFRNRLMFPIRDTRGRVVAFGGRALDDDPAKYLNSPETPVFHKGRMAYGLFEAKQARANLEQVLIVEGYMDVIALAQYGFDQAVATLGTATSSDHIQLLSRQCSRIVFCFDGDAAGLRAADRALDICMASLRDGMDIRFLFVPDGEDPDSLLRSEGADGFRTRLDAAVPLSKRLLERLSEGHDLSSAEGRAALMNAAKKTLSPIDAPAFRALMLQQLEQEAGLNKRTVSELIGAPQQREIQRRSLRAPQRMTPVRRAIVLLLNFPSCAEAFEDVEGVAASPVAGAPLLGELIDRLHSQPKMHCASLVNSYSGRPEQDILERLGMVDPEIDESSAISEFVATCEKLRRESRKTEMEQLLDDARQGRLSDEGKARLKALNQSRNNASNTTT